MTGSILLLLGSVGLSGIEPNTYVYRSAAQEESSTHVFVGTIRALHRVISDGFSPPKSDPTLSEFVAEVDVANVEKGTGVQPGDRVYVRFHSRASDQQIAFPVVDSGCDLVNYRLTPAVGHRARIYVILDEHHDYVADYPQSFFRIPTKGDKTPLFSKPVMARLQPIWWTIGGVFGSLMIVLWAGVALARARTKGIPTYSV